MTDAETRQAIVRIIKTHLRAFPEARIVLFGSRATGQHTPRSDYDIGIDAGTPIPLHVMGYIQADIEELPILQKVDVVDLSQASEALRREVTAVAQTW
jgi:predicted nucleotidyltransferase